VRIKEGLQVHIWRIYLKKDNVSYKKKCIKISGETSRKESTLLSSFPTWTT